MEDVTVITVNDNEFNSRHQFKKNRFEQAHNRSTRTIVAQVGELGLKLTVNQNLQFSASMDKGSKAVIRGIANDTIFNGLKGTIVNGFNQRGRSEIKIDCTQKNLPAEVQQMCKDNGNELIREFQAYQHKPKEKSSMFGTKASADAVTLKIEDESYLNDVMVTIKSKDKETGRWRIGKVEMDIQSKKVQGFKAKLADFPRKSFFDEELLTLSHVKQGPNAPHDASTFVVAAGTRLDVDSYNSLTKTYSLKYFLLGQPKILEGTTVHELKLN